MPTAQWLDWSGETGVWVCRCGMQGFGGYSLSDTRSAAMDHRARFHPDWPVEYKLDTVQPPCDWGETVWGRERGETCDRTPEVGRFCRSHSTTAAKYERLGMCAIEPCWAVATGAQPICATHVTMWARAHRLDMGQARAGVPQWRPE